MGLKNKTIIVSGGSGRLGSALAQELLNRGAYVSIADVKPPLFIDSLPSVIRHRLLFLEGDVTDIATADKMLIQTKETFGHLDGMVHSAYPRSPGWGTRFEELSPENLFFDLNTQLGGTILFAQRTIKLLREEKTGGAIVFISSIQGLSAPKFRHYEGTNMSSPIEYSAIKAGVNAVARYLAKYLAGENIRINTVSPGGIKANQPAIFLKRYRKDCINKGMLDPEDIVGTTCFLLSDDSKYINGQNIVVDDGWSL
ncbi:MAG: hypothetical protein AVO39_11750 [delta proteobacterium MLS_D]|nr:MAG: hypothetical protein AVO39_11750 [delta proteobacterium MLS_D]